MNADQRGAYRARPPLRQHAREWLRWKAGTVLCKPFWLVSDVGQAADRVGTRILVWSERASQSAPSRLAGPDV